MKKLLYSLLFLGVTSLYAQSGLEYQKPPQSILDLVDVELAPAAIFDTDKNYMITLQRDAFRTIEDMSREELRLGGLRIDPQLNIGSRTRYYHTIKIKNLKEKNAALQAVKGNPANAKLANFSLSPNESKIAMTNTTTSGVELWVLDIESLTMTKLSEPTINANTGRVIQWFENNQSLLVKMLPKNRTGLIDAKSSVPTGPTISTSDGKKAQNRTYQDLLKNPNDEFNFEQLATSEIHKINLDGSSNVWLQSDMYTGVTFSPDGNYVMVRTIEKPFSYLVPYYRFPTNTTIYTKDASLVTSVNKAGLVEDLPKGFNATIKGDRSFSWRSDKNATLVFVKALDGGNPANEVPFRDEVFELEAPFNGMPKSLVKTVNRYSFIQWGNENTAVVTDRWWKTRNTKSYVFNPSDKSKTPVTIVDRNYQDRYSDPGNFVTHKNENGSYVLSIDKGNTYLIGAGYTKDGQFPFVDKMNLASKKKTRLYTSTLKDKYESISDYDPKTKQLFVRMESKNEFPNYFVRSLKNKKLAQLSFFENPFKSIASVEKEVINYKRDDGLELSGTLYLPVGYDKLKKEKMPMILWAYPREYKDKASASQSTANPNRFTYPSYGSPIYWVTQGYVVLNNAAFPIVGEGDEEPNDSFRSQLVANGKAAIDAVDALGYIDRNRVAVGGHSYGAFMVANLLSHSNLYAAGIARSGAYNRTLTPFGFQSEERSYWDAPEVYYTMSPFMHADKMKTPLLLIHGEADNNSGTYPMQSERYFNALKGLGAIVRLVMLPKESHGYSAKESVLHMLWEQHTWMEKYVKNKKSKDLPIKKSVDSKVESIKN